MSANKSVGLTSPTPISPGAAWVASDLDAGLNEKVVNDLEAMGLTVETAAIRIGEAVFTLPRPNRHHNVMWWLHTLGVPAGLMHDSGFVLSDGTYVGRESALRVATAAGQLIQREGQRSPISPPNLYSEDLWEGGADLPTPDEIRALGNSEARPASSPAGTMPHQMEPSIREDHE